MHEVARERIAHVAKLCQSPMWSLSSAVDAKTTGFGQNDKAVVLQFPEGVRSSVLVKSCLLGPIAVGQINASVVSVFKAVVGFERDIDDVCIGRHCPPSGRLHCLDEHRHKRSLDPTLVFFVATHGALTGTTGSRRHGTAASLARFGLPGVG
ncbi:MAG: hypothetical protein WAK55_17895, partial [Xanthobacteraceae bacterium]